MLLLLLLLLLLVVVVVVVILMTRPSLCSRFRSTATIRHGDRRRRRCWRYGSGSGSGATVILVGDVLHVGEYIWIVFVLRKSDLVPQLR